MSTLSEQKEDARTWVAENCANGEHEGDGEPITQRTMGGELILTYRNGHVVQLRNCKHCHAVFPE